MKKNTKVIYLREKVIHSPNPDLKPHDKVLEEWPAVYLGESPADICNICHEGKESHARRGRAHAFIPIDPPGAEIEVQFSDEIGGTVILHHIQMGNTKNCYKQKGV